MVVKCKECRRKFEARRGTQFCSPACRARTYRRDRAAQAAKEARKKPGRRKAAEAEKPPEPSPFEIATLAELERLGATDTMLGQQVLTIARRMGRDTEAGATMATLSREHSRLMELLEAKAAQASDPVSQWEARLREKRERAAAGEAAG